MKRAFLVVFLVSIPAWGVHPEAKRLFDEGRKASEQGDYVTACARFKDSLAIESARGTLLNLGECHEKLGQFLDARSALARALALLPAGDARRALAEGSQKRLEQKLARITLLVPKDAGELHVQVDGAPFPKEEWNKELWVEPKEITLTVTAKGHHPWQQVLKPGAGSALTVSLSKGPPEQTVVRPVHGSDPPQSKLTLRGLGFALGGVGIAALGVGGTFGVMTLSRADTVRTHCNPDYFCDAEGYSAGKEGRWMEPLSTVTLIAGGVLTAAGIYLAFIGPRRTMRVETRGTGISVQAAF